MNLTESVALVTGASSGIGAAIALALLKAGVRVTATARRKEKLMALPSNESEKDLFLAIPADLSNESAIKDVFIRSDKKWGRLNFLINSAGVGIASTICNGYSNDWRQMLDVNVLAIAITTQEAIKRFPLAGGMIVNIGSTSGHRVASTNSSMYTATKFAVRGMTEAIRHELRALNNSSRICLISPGRVKTDFFQGNKDSLNEYPQLEARDVASIVLQIIQTPKEVEINEVIVRPNGQAL